MCGRDLSKTEELLLARAALNGRAEAIEQLEASYVQAVRPSLLQLSLSPDQCDEILQRLRVRLFTADRGPPGLSCYRGEGHLLGFVRATAIRLAIDMLRRQRPSEEELLERLSDPAEDVELSLIKRQYKSKLADALRRAWSRLKPAQRLVLKLQVQDRMSIDDMARLFRCHRSTTARRVVSARSELVRLTRQHLSTHHNLGRASIEEGLEIVKSQFSSILSKAFKDAG
jgi:RNA polymerase sigma-70 factor